MEIIPHSGNLSLKPSVNLANIERICSSVSPKDKPETYRVNLLLSSDLRFSPDPEQIIHPIPIKFEK
jgi:hypothetical protein